MQLQSSDTEICVLPALPNEWFHGSLTGVRVRGCDTVDIVRKDGRLSPIMLQADSPLHYPVICGRESTEVRVRPDRSVVLDGTLRELLR
jgi:alpha-L-fucosidase 2